MVILQAIDGLVSESFHEMSNLAEKYLFDNMARGAKHAQAAADATVRKWNSEEEGIAWNTYRAICRRSGVYESDRGSYVSIRPILDLRKIKKPC